MLSGRRPRGSKRTPVRGKIGRTSGSTNGSRVLGRSLMPCASFSPPPSREHQRGQPPPRAQGQRIGRPHHLEELDELLSRRLLVPFAVALEERQELVDRRLA